MQKLTQMFQDLVDGFNAARRSSQSEIRNYLPKVFSDGFVDDEKAEIDETVEATLREAEFQFVNGNYSAVEALAENAFLRKKFVFPLVYEHSLYTMLFERYLDDMGRKPSQAEAALAKFSAWHGANPHSGFAAAVHARALHSAGYAYRGTSDARNVTSEGWKQLKLYQQSALDLYKQSSIDHSGHWYWRQSYFDIAITDFRGEADHQLRFEKAIELQPYSLELWRSCVHHLLPRWHGDYSRIHDLMCQADARTKDRFGSEAYLELFRYVMWMEDADEGIIGAPKVLAKIAAEKAQSHQDQELTIAASLYAFIGDYEAFLNTISRIETLYTRNWFCAQQPALVIGVALQKRKRLKRTA